MRWIRAVILTVCTAALLTSSSYIAGADSTLVIDMTGLNPPADSAAFYDLGKDHWAYDNILYLLKLGIVSGDGQGYFHPEDPVTRAQFIKMLVLAQGILNNGAISGFLDVPYAAWHYPYISSAFAGEQTSGYFRPDDAITRQDMAFFSSMVSGKSQIDLSPAAEKIDFTDEAAIDDYAKTSVVKMQRAGIISGMTDGSFAPQSSLTRAQAAKIIYEISMRM